MNARLLFAHHVDAYDYFITTQLAQIIGEHNPFRVCHRDVRATRRTYYTSAENPLDANARYQKRVDSAARAQRMREEAALKAGNGEAFLEIEMKNLRVLEPTYVNSKGEHAHLSVKRALREGRSLNSRVVVDLVVTRFVKSGDKDGSAAVRRKVGVCESFELFLLPRMIRHPSAVPGLPAAGAFIVNGYLKVIQHQEHLSYNEIHIRKTTGSGGSKTIVGQVRCSHTDWLTKQQVAPKWRSTSTLYYTVKSDRCTRKIAKGLERDKNVEGGNESPEKHPIRIEVKVPYFTHPFQIKDVLSYLEPDISESYIQARIQHAQGPNPGEFDFKNHAKYRDMLHKRALTMNYSRLARPESALQSVLKRTFLASSDSDDDSDENSDASSAEGSCGSSNEDEDGDDGADDDENEDPDHSRDEVGCDSPDDSSEDSEDDEDDDECEEDQSGDDSDASKAKTMATTARAARKKTSSPSTTRARRDVSQSSVRGGRADDTHRTQRPKRPPPPTPGVVKNFMKEFYPCAGPDPAAKRTMYIRHVDALLRAYYGERSETDRDSMKHRRIRTSGVSLAQLVRQLFSTKMRTMRQLLSKNIDGANIDFVKKLMRQTCITKGIMFSMRGGAWGVKRSQKLKKGVCKMVSTINSLAVLSDLRQLKNPIMEEGKNPTPRQLHKDRFGLTCASESPEGKTVGLVNTLSVLGCIRTRPVPASQLAASLLSDSSRSSRHLLPINHESEPFPDAAATTRAGARSGRGWAVLANGVPFARVKKSLRGLYEAFRADRRDPNNTSVPMTTSFSLWRQDREVRISAEAGEAFRPLVRIRGMQRGQNVAPRAMSRIAQIVLEGVRQECAGGARPDAPNVSHEGRDVMPTIKVDLNANSGCPSCYLGAYDCPSGSWRKLIYEGPVEYISKSEESTLCVVRERILEGEPRATHAELHPQSAVMGLSACGVPFANCNQSPRVLYGSAMRKQAFGAPIPDPWIGSHFGCLVNPHRPLVNTAALRSLNKAHGVLGSYCQAVVVAVLPLGGYNQEDSYVVSQGAVDRGLFFSSETTTRRAHEGQLGTSRIVFGGEGHTDDDAQDSFDAKGMRRLGSRVRGGDALVRRELQSREMTPVPGAESGERKYSTEDKYRRHDVRWNASEIEEGRVDGVAQWSTGNGGRTVRVRVAQVGPIGVGDKVSSFHGQKGIIARIVPDEDMPRTASGVVPDLCINPHALPSRMTVGQLVELIAGKVACVEGSPVDGTPFSGVKVGDLMRRIEGSGYAGDCGGRELMYSGERGVPMGRVPIGVVSYMALRHRSFRKIQARGMSGRVNCVTKEATEGRRRAGGLRFGEMERDCLIAHGASAILRERLMEQSDGHIAQVCKRCGRLAIFRRGIRGGDHGGPWCPACASEGKSDPGSHVVPVRIPYAMRVVYNNLAAQNIHMKLNVSVEPRLAANTK